MILTPRTRNAARGFTLVEILIVVLILGILAAIVIPSFANAASDMCKTAFTQGLRTFTGGFPRYQVDNSGWPIDGGGVNTGSFRAFGGATRFCLVLEE